MNILLWASITAAELVLIILVLLFFKRLRRSEHILVALQNNQEELMDRMMRNTTLEQEMVSTFIQRQEQMERLNIAMEERIRMLKKLMKQAEEISHSPYFLREIIINCRKKGQTVETIAKSTGLAKDEVELIIKKEGL